MARALALLLAVVPLAAGRAISQQDTAYGANPIRRVVDMLQMMQKKVTEEGKKEEELFDKFMCYCKTGGADLSASISAAEAKVGQLDSSIPEAEASKAQLQQDLKTHQTDRSEAKDAVAKATALREKEAAAFTKESTELKTNIAALGKATKAIEDGAAGSFLQTTEAAVLRRLTVDVEMSAADRDMMSSFLSVGQSEGYVPKSGEITGILKEMKDTMDKELTSVTDTETTAVSDYEALVAAKEKEIAANTKAIESKTERLGQVSVEIVEMKEDLDDTQKVLLEDQKFLADMDENCAKKKAEWEERSKTRADELVALAETIKILNDDDALELFKKTLPSASLLQTKNNNKDMKDRALNVLRTGRGKTHLADSRLDLILVALTGKQSGTFDSVIKMIDEMVEVLGKEQMDDDHKKEYCGAQLDKTEDDAKVLDQTLSDLGKAIEESTGAIATLKEEIATLVKEVKKLDKDVAEAMETRKEEHEEYVSTMAANKAAKDLIAIAKNRLAKFYNPKMYKAPPKRELSAEDRIAVNMGGEAPATEAPGGIAGTGVTYIQEYAPSFAQISRHTAVALRREAPAPPPETWDAYQNKGQENAGVSAMLDMLVADLDKEIQEMDVQEKDSQSEYEKFTMDSATTRAAKSKSIATKENTKADLEMEVQKMTGEKKNTMSEAMAKAEYLKDLHLECDWLLANFDARKEARAGEVESLKKAKAVLSGADFALLQTDLSDIPVAHLRGYRRQ